jgi:hypothetical protein
MPLHLIVTPCSATMPKLSLNNVPSEVHTVFDYHHRKKKKAIFKCDLKK